MDKGEFNCFVAHLNFGGHRFLETYRVEAAELMEGNAAGSVKRRWWQARNGISLSKVAMCYALLHEQDLLGSCFKRSPALWKARSLEDLEMQLWQPFSGQ